MSDLERKGILANWKGSGNRYVLRKKPPGHAISPVAHRIDREYKVLKALGSVKDFPVPKVYDICLDNSIIGTQYYVLILFAVKSYITNFRLGDGIC